MVSTRKGLEVKSPLAIEGSQSQRHLLCERQKRLESTKAARDEVEASSGKNHKVVGRTAASEKRIYAFFVSSLASKHQFVPLLTAELAQRSPNKARMGGMRCEYKFDVIGGTRLSVGSPKG